MLKDIQFVLRRWRVIHLLGISTLRARYARSKFGQLWLSISTFLFILAIGSIWSMIWGMSIKEYLPYVGIGQIIYLVLAQTINESSGIYVADARLYLNDRVPFLTSVCAHIYRNLIVFAHNIPTMVLLIMWSGEAQPSLTLMYPVSIFLALLFMFMVSYSIATLCTCYRDLIQIVSLVMQVSFLLSPVMWKVDMLPAMHRDYIYLNPFAAFLEVLRNPLLGIPVNDIAYIALAGWTGAALVVMLLIYRKFDRTTIFWV